MEHKKNNEKEHEDEVKIRHSTVGDRVRQRIAEKITEGLSMIFEKSLSLSADNLRESIYRMESYVVHFIKMTLLKAVAKIFLFIFGIGFIIFGVYEVLQKYLSPEYALFVMGVALVLLSAIIRLKPLTRVKHR